MSHVNRTNQSTLQGGGNGQSLDNVSFESSFDLDTDQPAKLEHDSGSPGDVVIPQHDQAGFLRNRQVSDAIESDQSSKRPSVQSLSHGAIPGTARAIGDKNEGGSPPDGWPSDPGLGGTHRRRDIVRHRFLFGLLHYIKVVVLSIIVILLLVAVGIPVSDNGVPQAGDYSKMEFDWTTDPRS
ncbi:hypothetical protein EV175_001614, partial [Coemansia sp. RSA 1933]